MADPSKRAGRNFGGGGGLGSFDPDTGWRVANESITSNAKPMIQWPDGSWHPILPKGPDPSSIGSPGTGDTPAQQQIREATVTAANGPIPLVYGTQRVGGRIFYVNTFSGNLALGIAFCEGPVSSLAAANITIDNTLLLQCQANGWILGYELHDGSLSQTVSTILSGWFGYTNQHPGLCYMVLVVSGAAPWTSIPNILAKIDGLLCYDPRGTPTTAFTRNPSLIARDMMTRCGGLVTSDFDDVSVGDAATYYDATIDGEPRYTLNLAIVAGGKLSTWLSTVQGHCGLSIYPDQGVYVFAPDKVLSTPIPLTDQHLTNVRISRKNMVDVPTRLTLEWTNAANDWITDTVTAETDAVAGGTEEAIEGTVSCPGLTSYKTAQRHALYTLRRENFSNLVINATVSAMAEQLRRGDYVTLTHRGSPAGVAAPTYRLAGQGALVSDVRPRGGGVFDVTFEEYDVNAYSTATYVPDTPPATFLPDRSTAPNLFIRFDASDWPTMAKCRWEVRPLLPTQLYGASYWIAMNTPGSAYTPTAAKINDGDLTNVAFGFDGIGANYLTFDAGAGQARRFVGLRLYWPSSITLIHGQYGVVYWMPVVRYSDDNSTWTTCDDREAGTGPLSGSLRKLFVSGVWRGCEQQWNDYGAHRYWQLSYGTGGTDTHRVWTEAQFLEGSGVAFDETAIDHYEIHARGTDAECTAADPDVMNLPASSRPTYAQHLDLSKLGIVYQTGEVDPVGGSLFDKLNVRVVTAMRDGSRSAGDQSYVYGFAYLNVVTAPGYAALAAVPPPVAGVSRLYADATTNQLMLSNNGGAYAPVSTGSGSGTVSGSGVAGRVAFWTSASALSSDTALLWDSTNDVLMVGNPLAPVATSGAGLEVSGADGTVGRIEVSSFGAATAFTGRRANGTAASRTAVTTNDALAQLNGIGYTSAGAYASVCADIRIVAAEPFTSAAQGGYIVLRTSLIGTTTPVERVRILDSGFVGIGTTTPRVALEVAGTGKAAIAGNGFLWLANTTAPNDYTTANYDRFGLGYASDVLLMQTSAAGTGTLRPMHLQVGGAVTGLYIDTLNRVGIGTNGPSEKLHVFVTSGNVYNLIETGSSTGVGVAVAFKTSARRWEIGQSPGIGDNGFTIYDATAGSVRQRFDTSGNVTFYSGATVTAAGGFIGPACTVPQNAQSTGYTLALGDRGKHVAISAAVSVTVPASVFSAGDVISIYNGTTGTISIVQGASVTLYIAGSGATGSRNIATRGIATILCVASNTFVVTGGGVS